MATGVAREAKLSRTRSVEALRIRERREELEARTLSEHATRPAGGHRERPEGFRHNEQSVRIVERIENNGAGLNLTHEVRDGILKHSAPTEGGVETAPWGRPETPEGWVVRYADKIAYLHHDIDDAMRAGIV